MSSLCDLQVRLSKAIRAREDLLDTEQLLAPSGLSLNEALDVYRGNYFDGLAIHCKNVFAQVFKIIGWQNLLELVKMYTSQLDVFPYDLRFFGESFSHFLRQNVLEEDEGWLADVADVDWKSHELAFDESGSFRVIESSYELSDLIAALDRGEFGSPSSFLLDSKSRFSITKRGTEIFLRRQ